MSFIIIFGTLSFPMTAKGRIAAAIYRIRLSYRPHGGQYLYFDRNGRGMPPPLKYPFPGEIRVFT